MRLASALPAYMRARVRSESQTQYLLETSASVLTIVWAGQSTTRAEGSDGSSGAVVSGMPVAFGGGGAEVGGSPAAVRLIVVNPIAIASTIVMAICVIGAGVGRVFFLITLDRNATRRHW